MGIACLPFSQCPAPCSLQVWLLCSEHRLSTFYKFQVKPWAYLQKFLGGKICKFPLGASPGLSHVPLTSETSLSEPGKTLRLCLFLLLGPALCLRGGWGCCQLKTQARPGQAQKSVEFVKVLTPASFLNSVTVAILCLVSLMPNL